MGKLDEHDPLYDDMSFLKNKKIERGEKKMKRLGGILVCNNYQSNHPSVKENVQSTTCKGCINRVRIDYTTDAFVIDNDPDNINCINFRGVKEEKVKCENCRFNDPKLGFKFGKSELFCKKLMLKWNNKIDKFECKSFELKRGDRE